MRFLAFGADGAGASQVVEVSVSVAESKVIIVSRRLQTEREVARKGTFTADPAAGEGRRLGGIDHDGEIERGIMRRLLERKSARRDPTIGTDASDGVLKFRRLRAARRREGGAVDRRA